MPTIISHAAIPLALGFGLGSRVISRPLLLVGVVASALPDFDVLAFQLRIAYGNILGHRGLSHSLIFALLLGCVAAMWATRLRSTYIAVFGFVGFSALSHGLLDMCTNGGLGVAMLWPWFEQRFFFPWQVIEVSPIGVTRIFSERGLAVLRSELFWIWLPALILASGLILLRQASAYLGRQRGRQRSSL
ncbi:MAG: metal-dependent hydrolase [Burkholderiaceae bacterium]|jgi:inner membrane protein|nr:metal-dependent hydrolase [Burkholderiaceae bacterium]